jgi:protein-S-isoprenylcysteine O-methyltransferase Ste14
VTKTKGGLPPTWLFISITAMALLHFLAPVSTVVQYPWTLLGIVPFTAGVILNLLADSSFKKARTTVKPFEISTALITTGVFQISRHPMYLGMVLILIGLAVFMGTITPFIIIAIFAVLMEMVFVRTEEKMLAQKFGPAWNIYRDKVRKWF